MSAAGTKTLSLRSRRHPRAHALPNALLREAALSLPDDGLDSNSGPPNPKTATPRALLLWWTNAEVKTAVPEWVIERVTKELVESAHGSENESGSVGHLGPSSAWRLFGDSLPDHQVVPSTAVLAAALNRLLLMQDGTTEFAVTEGD